MSDESPVEGRIFRRNYVRERGPLADSERARRRLLMWFMRSGSDSMRGAFANDVVATLGVDYPSGSWGYLHANFWVAGDISDVLSAITIWIKKVGVSTATLAAVRQILEEEQLRYRLDDQGGIHFGIDEEFERTVSSAIMGLGAPKFSSARAALAGGLAALALDQQSGKRLIRGVFEAVESAFLIVIAQEGIDRIADGAIDEHLRPILLARYAGWLDAEEITSRVLRILKAWVKVGHYYRHGSALEQLHEPPLDLAIAIASEGMSMLRYIVHGAAPLS